MSLSAPFIRRPIATSLLMVAIVLLGGVAYEMLPVAALPNVQFPTISVTAQLPGADPQTMASSVAQPLEYQFAQIPYLTQMTSTSSEGYTTVNLQFALSDNINAAAQFVQTAINAAAGQLPKDMPTQPTYHETNPADAPILVLGFTSNSLPVASVADYAESILAEKLSQVPGVGLVTIGGTKEPAIRIRFNPAQLAANGLDLETVRTALTNVSVDEPKGDLYGKHQAFALQTNDQLLTPQGWDNQIIAYRNGGPIRVRDVGQAMIGSEDITLGGWVNLHRGVILAIQRLPGANVITTVQAIKKALPQIEGSIPPNIKISVISDRTITIRAAVADVQHTLILTLGLVVAVIFLFLRSAWPTLIPAVAVPVSIIGTFAVMYVFGYSLDNLSLMGLSIAIGFVVDDAIVMVENVARHVEMGKPPMQAALDAAGEIGFTIMSISLSLVAVFIPLLLMSGLVGLMFQEFAVTVTVAIMVSLLVSLTLTPMMGGRLLRQEHPEQRGRLSRGMEWCFDALLGAYDRALVVALRHRFITLMVMLATVVGMLYENLIHPLTIISTLPAAGLGALLTLDVFGFGLDVMGMIGIILLIGIVKKNGIMLVDFALETERTHGLTPEESIHEACRLRFRPIMMTTMCALLAAVPLMLGTGYGSELRQPLGYAMAGGLLVSQVLTLFTTPIVYIYMERLGRALAGIRGGVDAHAAAAAE
jgi:multidrug efflux pump subunit AcrB